MSRKNKRAPWEEEEEIIWVSKTEMKRDMDALQKIGEELVNLKPSALAKVPLDETLLAAIHDAQRFKNEARRRQMQYVGRLMRSVEVEPIQAALDMISNKHAQLTLHFQRLEKQRDAIVEGDDSQIEIVMTEFPHADRQRLRLLARQAKKEKASNKPPKAYREIFQYLKTLFTEE